MINLEPKISNEERNLLREYCDQRGGMNLAAQKTGVNRNTIRYVIHSGMCSDETANKIRTFLKTIPA